MKATHIEILKSELELRRSRNPAYSLRSYSRDLGLVPSALSDLLQQKKGISPARAKSLAEKLALTVEEKELFVLSAQAFHGRRKKEREKACAQLKMRERTHSISEKELAAAGNWYHQAILELTELASCEHTVGWFAKRLGISPSAVAAALDRLIQLGWLKIDKGKYRSSSSASASSMDIPSQSIKQLHGQILDRASGALFSQGTDEREFISTSFAFDSSQTAEAKKAIRDFQRRFSERFYSASNRRDSVYQISVQFFRLDQGEEK